MRSILVRRKCHHYDKTVRSLRDALELGILREIPGTERNGHAELRLANTSNIHFPGVESEALLLLLDQAGICASSGSACLADSPDPSHVIAAMKLGEAAHHSIRFSLGTDVSAQEIKTAIELLRQTILTLKQI